MSIRDEILATPYVRETVAIDVPQWPTTAGNLFLKTPTALQMDRYSALIRKADRDPNVCLGAEIAVLVVVDQDGSPVFTATDTAKLGDGDPAPLNHIFDKWLSMRPKDGDAEKK